MPAAVPLAECGESFNPLPWTDPHRSFARRTFAAVAFILLGSSAAVLPAAEFPTPEPLTPTIEAASEEASADMSNIRLDDGLSIDLIAAEPLVANIVAFDIDDRGRLYVCETFRQGKGVTDNRAHDERWLKRDLAAKTVQDRIDYFRELLGDAAITYAQQDDRIRRLVDTDGDGKYDDQTVFASGFNHLEEGTGAGVLAIGNSVYYTCIPKLWKFDDRDDDGEAESRVVLSDGYGVRVAFRGHDSHGLIRGPDGRLYFSIGDRGYHITTDDGRVLSNPESGAVFSCELDGSDLRVVADGMRNPQELAFNDYGDLFSVDNNSDSGDKARVIQIVPGGDAGWRMHYQYLGDRGIFNREKVWHPLHPEQTVSILPPIENFTDGPSGLAHYPGTGFGDRFQDQFFICDFRGGPANSGIRSFRLEPNGASYDFVEVGQPIWQVLATDVAFAPDGGMIVSDWVDGWNGLGKGRMYRVNAATTDPRSIEVAELLAADAGSWKVPRLIELMGHPDRRLRLKSQFELAARDEVAVMSELAENGDADRLARLHAIWGLNQIARRDKGLAPRIVQVCRSLVLDDDTEVRRAAVLALGRRQKIDTKMLAAAMKDDEPRVKYAGLTAAADVRDAEVFAEAVDVLASTDNDDPVLRHAVLHYFSTAATDAQMVSLVGSKNELVRRVAVAALRRVNSYSITKFLDDASTLVVDEAIRGIHDGPVAAGYASALALLDDPETSAALTSESVRRLVNIADRVRDADAANHLVAIAADTRREDSARVQALENLASWTGPREIDLYDHAFRPRAAGDTEAAAASLRQKLQELIASADLIRDAAIAAAAELNLQEIVPNLETRIVDDTRDGGERATALRGLARLQPQKAVELAGQMKLTPAGPQAEAALKILAEHGGEAFVKRFVEATRSNDAKLQQLGYDLMARFRDPAVAERLSAAVSAWRSGDLSPAVRLNVAEAVDAFEDENLQRELAAVIDEASGDDPLGDYLIALEGGDVDAGSKLFYEKTELSCVRCHRVHRTGGEVGPDLTTIGKEKDRRYLLEAICDPNAAIAKGFETAVIATDSGDVHTGIVMAEDDTLVKLALADGQQVEIYQDEIIARREGKSSMPADLIKYMSRRELRDLVAYLASLQVDPRSVDAEEIE